MPCRSNIFNYRNFVGNSVGGGTGNYIEILPSPGLIVSNEPETIPQDLPGATDPLPVNLPLTLYKTTVSLGTGFPYTLRVFFWHINDRNSLINVGIRLSSNFCTVNSIKRSVRIGDLSTILDEGLCLAQSQLFKTLEDIPGSITLNSTETTVWSATLGAKNTSTCLVGCVMEFTCSIPSFDLNIRTYAEEPTGLPSTFALDPNPDIPVTHVRGCWPYSSILMKLTPDSGPKFDVQSCL